MCKIIKYKRILVYSPDKRGFGYDLDSPVLIVHGANTSGKSTLIQTILYILGINEMNKYMQGIYSSSHTLRLDVEIIDGSEVSSVVFVRCGGSLRVKLGDDPVVEFNDISSNSSYEHIRLKQYLRLLFGFDLMLFSGDSYKDAPIETALLPYYIPQSVGWVSIRKNFEGLDFYRNFREDYLNYCFGISNGSDLERRDAIDKEIDTLKRKIEALESTKDGNESREIVLLQSDIAPSKCTEYIHAFNEDEEVLTELNLTYTRCCEELSLLKSRRKVLKEVERSLTLQDPESDALCPICKRQYKKDLTTIYEHLQSAHDTRGELKNINVKIGQLNSKIDSIEKKIRDKSSQIEKKRNVFEGLHIHGELTMTDWINSRIHNELSRLIDVDICRYQSQLMDSLQKRQDFKSDEIVKQEQEEVNSKFRTKFISYLHELGVDYKPYLQENRFFDVYKISALPYQGVELLEAMMAYHFAFNEMVKDCGVLVRFPFLLDAIFKEDIDSFNKRKILTFISRHIPKDTQLLFSMADISSSDDIFDAETCNKDFFENSARLLFVSNEKKDLLKNLDDSYDSLIAETEEL